MSLEICEFFQLVNKNIFTWTLTIHFLMILVGDVENPYYYLIG